VAVAKCDDCGGLVSHRAQACPHCGAPSANRPARAQAASPDGARRPDRPLWKPLWLTLTTIVGLWIGHQIATGAMQHAQAVSAVGGDNHGAHHIVAAVAYGLPVGFWLLVRAITK
jgi:hypothetical protein